MLGKRVYFGNPDIAPYEWMCAATCNTACNNTAKVRCKCSKDSAKASSNSYVSTRSTQHMNNLSSSSD